MSWMHRMILGGLILRAPEGDGTGGGGGGGGTPDPKDKEISDLKAKIAEMEKTKTPPKQDHPADLAAKAAKEREDSEKKAKHEKQLEHSIRFTGQAKEWAKSNASLLPKNIDSILDTAEKEKYDSVIQKDAAIKVALIQEFFGQQPNLDLLTGSQKVALEDFKNLTKDKKQEQAQHVFDTLFEPTFETLKKVKRAEQIAKGHADQSTGEQAYRDRRLKLARKQHLGEKQ